jgi:chaperone LolA
MNTPQRPASQRHLFRAACALLLGLVLALLPRAARPQAPASGQDRLDWILKEYEAASKKLKTLQANLTHTKTNKMLDVSETLRGRLKMKRPRKLLLDTTEPTPSKKIVNGDIAWIYEPKLNQAQKLYIKDNARGLKDINPLELAYAGDLDELKRYYTITLVGEETVAGKTFCTLSLKIKENEGEAKYASIVLKMEEGQWVPTEIKTSDEGGEVEEDYKLTDLVLDQHVSDSDFNFSPPLGVEVVEPQKE